MDSFQLTVLIGLFTLVIVNVAYILWALGGKLHHKSSSKRYNVHVDGAKVFSRHEMTEVGQKAEADLAAAAAQSSDDFHAMLDATMTELNTKAKDMITQTLSKEFEAYHNSLAKVRTQTLKEFTDIKKASDEQKKNLQDEFEAKVTAQEALRLDQFNQRLDDIVSSYIVESLEHNVDLGAQMKYIIASLESRKEDIKKDVLA